MTTINDLPNEILLMIFKYTRNKKDLTCTCKRWNELIVNFLRLSIYLYDCDRIRKFLDTTFTRRYHMLSIDDIDSDFDWPDSSRQVESLGPERFSLGLGCALLHKCLQLVRQSEGTLREMSLSIGPVMANSLREFLPQGDEPSSLESLAIKFNEWPDDWIVEQIESIAAEGLQEIAEMPKLKWLGLEYEEEVRRDDQTARRMFTDEIVRKAKALTSLSLVSSPYDCYPDLRIVQSFSTQLQELYCDISSPFAEDFFQLALPAVKILTLNFFWCSERPDATWFFKNAKSLIDLTVFNISTEEFFRQGVYRGAAAVERLIIRGEKIPMDGLQGMARLKELELNIDCRQIAVPCSSSLQKLVINGKTNGFNFYGGLAQSLPNTTELCINTEDETWNDDCLRAICTTMTNIRRLTIYHAIGESVTDMSYRYIGNLRQLEYFCLKTDPTAFMFGLAPNDLNFSNWVSLVWASEIHLSGFHKIDQNQLLCFMKNPKLRRLTLELCVLEDDARKLLREHEMTVPRPLPHIACDGWR